MRHDRIIRNDERSRSRWRRKEKYADAQPEVRELEIHTWRGGRRALGSLLILRHGAARLIRTTTAHTLHSSTRTPLFHFHGTRHRLHLPDKEQAHDERQNDGNLGTHAGGCDCNLTKAVQFGECEITCWREGGYYSNAKNTAKGAEVREDILGLRK